MHKIMAVLYRPIVEKSGKYYSIEAYESSGMKLRAQVFKKMKAEDVNSCLVFFWSLGSELSTILPLSLMERTQKILKTLQTKTYNNVIDTIKCVGDNHLQIFAVTTGDIWDIDLEKNTLFPLMHINPVNVIAGENSMTLNFQIFICDLVEPHGSNEQEVLSDTLQIATDIISIFMHGEVLYFYNKTHGENARYFTEGDYTLEPFTERFDNSVTGWVFTLPVVIENRYETCNIPNNKNICVQ